MHTLREFEAGDVRIAMLTDGDYILELKMVTAEEFERLQAMTGMRGVWRWSAYRSPEEVLRSVASPEYSGYSQL